ncbi:MAG: hypothetical protein IKE21_07590 [Erysipelotrichaceae bacterium]|nr:hypothetical protein [Erysipelotrichaceae bacterium]
MFYCASKNSHRKIVHRLNCHHIRQIHTRGLYLFMSLEEALLQGYHPCADCLTEEKAFDGDYRKVRDLLSLHSELRWKICHDHLQITTNASGWKILPCKHIYRLFHRNDNGISEIGAEMPGYHDQKVHYRDICQYFSYILEHDAYRKAHPTKPTKKKGSDGYRKQEKKLKAWKKHRKATDVMKTIDRLSRVRAAHNA